MGETRNGITIAKGSVTVEGSDEVVATVMQDLKHGYHPCIAIRVGLVVHWVELDTKNLIDECFRIVEEELTAAKII